MKTNLKLYDNKIIEFIHPEKFHLPQFLNQQGLINYEPVSQASFLAAAKFFNGSVLDIGANIGIYSLAVASALNLPVYAFEPYKEAADVLEKIKTQYNYCIKVQQCAIGENDCQGTLYISRKSDMSNSLNPNFRRHIENREISVKSIDTLLSSSNQKIGAMKIDTETTELEVLKGAENTIRRWRPAILLEVLKDDKEILISDFFNSINYKIIQMGDPSYHAILACVSSFDKTGDQRNYLALPVEFTVDDLFYDKVRFFIKLIHQCSMKQLP